MPPVIDPRRLQVKYIRESDPEIALLHAFLTDEPRGSAFSDGASEASSMGFAQWTDHIRTEVQKSLAQAG